MKIDKIGLIATDFDDLQDMAWGRMLQYVNMNDCPIFKALKRLGHNVEKVQPWYFIIDGEKIYFDGANCITIQESARKFLHGAEVVYIHADNTSVTL